MKKIPMAMHRIGRVALVLCFGTLYIGCTDHSADTNSTMGEDPELSVDGAQSELSSDELRRRRDAGSDGGARVDAGSGLDGGLADAGKPTGDATVPPSDSGIALDAGAPGFDAAMPGDAGSVLDGGNQASSGKWVSGYYAAYQRVLYPPDQIDWTGLSHIILTRIKTDGGGRLQLDFDIDAVNGPVLARDIAQRAHLHGKKALLMLGGAGQGAAILNSVSNANRPSFVAALLKAVSDFGFDGLDLDWEDQVDMDLFIALARDLRTATTAPAGLILTAPGFPLNPNVQAAPSPKVATLVAYLDQYNLMTYYPATALAGWGWLSWHNCPLSGQKAQTPVAIDDSLARYASAGIPKGKLGMGVAFYAICYTGGVTAPNQSTEAGVTIQGGDNDFPLSRLFASDGAFKDTYRHWDSVAQVPYLSLPTAEAHGCRYVSFDDEQSLVAKGAFTRANGYGGVIVWTINQGWLRNSTRAQNALMQALKRGFLDP